jgi:hypothetical protein
VIVHDVFLMLNQISYCHMSGARTITKISIVYGDAHAAITRPSYTGNVCHCRGRSQGSGALALLGLGYIISEKMLNFLTHVGNFFPLLGHDSTFRCAGLPAPKLENSAQMSYSYDLKT